MSKPIHGERTRQLAIWLPRDLLNAVYARADRAGISRKLAIVGALAAFVGVRGRDKAKRKPGSGRWKRRG